MDKLESLLDRPSAEVMIELLIEEANLKAWWGKQS